MRPSAGSCPRRSTRRSPGSPNRSAPRSCSATSAACLRMPRPSSSAAPSEPSRAASPGAASGFASSLPDAAWHPCSPARRGSRLRSSPRRCPLPPSQPRRGPGWSRRWSDGGVLTDMAWTTGKTLALGLGAVAVACGLGITAAHRLQAGDKPPESRAAPAAAPGEAARCGCASASAPRRSSPMKATGSGSGSSPSSARS